MNAGFSRDSLSVRRNALCIRFKRLILPPTPLRFERPRREITVTTRLTVSGTHLGYLVAAFSCLCLMGFADNLRGPLFPAILADLGLSDTQGGLMFAASCAGSMAGGLLFRRLVRRFSSLRTVQMGLFMGAAGLWGITLSETVTTLLATSFIFGLAGGGLALSQNLMVEEGSPPIHRRQWLSGLHSIYGVASLVAPLVVNALSSRGAGWRAGIQLSAALIFALAILLAWVKPLPPRSAARPQGADRPPGLLRRQLGIAFMVSFAVTAELVISTRLVQLLERDGFPAHQAGWALSAFFGCLLLGRLGCSLKPIRLSSRTLIVGSGLGSLVLFAGGLYFQPLLLPLVALTLGPFFPITVDMVADEFGAHLEDTLGLMVVVVSLVLAGAHFLLGVWSDAVTLKQAFWLGPIALTLALACLWATRPRQAVPGVSGVV